MEKRLNCWVTLQYEDLCGACECFVMLLSDDAAGNSKDSSFSVAQSEIFLSNRKNLKITNAFQPHGLSLLCAPVHSGIRGIYSQHHKFTREKMRRWKYRFLQNMARSKMKCCFVPQFERVCFPVRRWQHHRAVKVFDAVIKYMVSCVEMFFEE